MQTKLTLRLDDQLIETAKGHAERRGKSLSRLVADFFEALSAAPREKADAYGPITRRLKGSLKGTGDRQEYREYLRQKYS